MARFIHKFKVTKWGGRGYGNIVLATYSDMTTAINQAKRLLSTYGELCVVEERYADERNMNRDICFDYHVCWASWLGN